MSFGISRRLVLWLAIASIFAMVITPLGAFVGPTQVAAAQESSDATPAAEDEATATSTAEPTETVVPDEPTAEPTEEPEPTETEVPGTPEGEDPPIELSDTTISQVAVTPYCFRTPEMVRIDNNGDTAITILSIQPQFDGVGGTAYPPSPGAQNIVSGGTKIYRSGPAATSGTVLTTESLFFSTNALVISIVVTTSVGNVTVNCESSNPNLLITKPTDVIITLNCVANPETARIDNTGTAAITINSVESLNGSPAAIATNRSLGAGKTVIYRSNTGATTGTILTPEEFYTDSAYQADGIRLNTSIGVIEKACPAKPSYPSQLEVTIDCKNLPEWVKIKNVGQGPVTITGIESLYQKKSIEPFTLNKTLQPGQGIIYRSGTTGSYANVLTSQYLYNPNVGEAEGARVFTKTGKTFVVRCPGSPRIEVNLTTQMLYAWEGNTLVNSTAVATGKDGFLTPTGRFRILTKEGTIRMAACSGGECWDVPNVPHSMLFLEGGFYLHGAYWHNNFGIARTSHGCVNLPLGFAAWLFGWAQLGTEVWIHY